MTKNKTSKTPNKKFGVFLIEDKSIIVQANGKNQTMQFERIEGGYRYQNSNYKITLKFSQNEDAPTIEQALVKIAKKRTS